LIRKPQVRHAWRATANLAAWVIGCLLALAASLSAADLDGQRLYSKHCASCHGPEGRGDGPDAGVFAPAPRNLREGFLKQYQTDALVRRIRDGTPLQLALDLPALQAHATEVNALVSHLQRLPTIDWATVADGWAIYNDRCEVCHGRYGGGSSVLPPGVRPPRALSDPAFQRSISDQELILVVRHGRKGMPALTPRVPESAAQPLAGFARVLSPGFELYTQYCASCYGDDGLAVRHPAGSLGLPTVTFDRQYFARRDPTQLHEAVWHMLKDQKPAMPHYRWTMSEAEARAIVEYLQRSDAARGRHGRGPIPQ